MAKNKKLLYALAGFAILAVVIAGFLVFFPMNSAPVKVIGVGGSNMLIAECGDSKYIEEQADYIVEGKVEKAEVKALDVNGIEILDPKEKERRVELYLTNAGQGPLAEEDILAMFTYSDIAIGKYLKGAPLPGDRLQIVTPGGEACSVSGCIADSVEDQPVLHEGLTARIYLGNADNELYIICGLMGLQWIEGCFTKDGVTNCAGNQ
ncbi:MAG: hypothetical protein NT067_06380 [Candidatus Diapherotrites archaeon]|nr:hypothetical protein [Candidatus Diapherotrites archaeon]